MAANRSTTDTMVPAHGTEEVPDEDIIKEMQNKWQQYGKKDDKKEKMARVIAVQVDIASLLVQGEGAQFVSRFNNVVNSYKSESSPSVTRVTTHFVEFAKVFKEIDESSVRQSRLLREIIQDFVDLYNKAVGFVELQKAGDIKSNLVTVESISEGEPRRQYLKGGGFLPEQPEYQSCFLCGHTSVDCPPQMINHDEKIEELMKEYEADVARFNQCMASGHPFHTSKTGKVSKRKPSLVVPPYLVRCHCSQMACTSITGQGTCPDCNVNGADIDADGICLCEQCKCPCNKAYKVSVQKSCLFKLLSNLSSPYHRCSSFWSYRQTIFSRWELPSCMNSCPLLALDSRARTKSRRTTHSQLLQPRHSHLSFHSV
jgi:hypothetical protein